MRNVSKERTSNPTKSLPPELEHPAVGAWDFAQEKAEKISQPVLYVGSSESSPLFSEETCPCLVLG